MLTEEQVNKFREYHDSGEDEVCPSCAANWVLLPQPDGVVFILMDHDLNCAYLAWELAEDRAWMEY